VRCLIVEDDFISRKILRELLLPHFDTEIAVNGEEAVTAFKLAHEAKEPYDMIFYGHHDAPHERHGCPEGYPADGKRARHPP